MALELGLVVSGIKISVPSRPANRKSNHNFLITRKTWQKWENLNFDLTRLKLCPAHPRNPWFQKWETLLFSLV
jgi:hypothetical protein